VTRGCGGTPRVVDVQFEDRGGVDGGVEQAVARCGARSWHLPRELGVGAQNVVVPQGVRRPAFARTTTRTDEVSVVWIARSHPAIRLRWRHTGTVSFSRLTGLADGLVPKERHYARNAIRPKQLGSPFPVVAV
jgi:hypothetical protein